ncbi:MAG: GNAT family N-acetyltransferase [Deltaproteobacteria bacterium]|nr:GNAT family N-acetyltransferase [Deltaproteobacteria bacterium]
MFEIRPLDLSPTGLEQTARLLRAVFPAARHLDAAYLDRLYHGNPAGETFGLCAHQDGELVGHYLMIPIRARLFGQEETGIWPFQLATHPAHRLKGLFSAFVEESFGLCRDRGYGFFAGVGNANSTPIFVKKWGYQCIRSLDAKIGLGPAPQSGDDGELDLVRLWDRDSIAWRLTHPARPYSVARSKESARLYARGPYGIPVEVGAFPEAVVPRDLPRLPSPRPLRFWVGADPTRSWARSAYVDVPARVRPSPLNLLFFDLSGAGRHFEPSRVRYEVFDFDAY